MRLNVFVAMGMVGALVPASAQEAGVSAAQERAAAVVTVLDSERMIVAEKMAIEAGQRAAVQARVTPGAPYSGEAINESVQVLADGNRISKKSVSRIYRDSEGRSRREFVAADGQVESISISDPIAGVSYLLYPGTKTAVRNRAMIVTPDGGVATATVGGGRGGFVEPARTPGTMVQPVEAKQADEVRVQGGGGGRARGGTVSTPPVNVGTVAYPAMGMAMAGAVGKTTTEDLGQQVVEGVMAAGTRSTTVFEAGALGNERPIHVVSEQWMATDLKLLVATKHSDPRSGETTYRLTNITQAEPPRSLFELPADYTLRESTIRRPPAFEKQ